MGMVSIRRWAGDMIIRMPGRRWPNCMTSLWSSGVCGWSGRIGGMAILCQLDGVCISRTGIAIFEMERVSVSRRTGIMR